MPMVLLALAAVVAIACAPSSGVSSPDPARKVIVFVTIDEVPDQGGHEPNLARLREVASQRGLTVERRYMTEVEDLDRSSVLMLFLAGSWPEWIQTRRNPAWESRLTRFGTFVRQTDIPILAVCGSHQLLGAVYAGWDAVGHVRAEGDAVSRTIARERETDQSLIPSPRVGEVGAFPLTVRVADPLFEGMQSPLYFMQHHFDEVIEGARSREMTTLVENDHVASATHNGHPARAAVQALRLEHPTKLLYTLQFHPDLPSAVVRGELVNPNDALLARADEDGEKLLVNFFGMAERYWKPRS